MIIGIELSIDPFTYDPAITPYWGGPRPRGHTVKLFIEEFLSLDHLGPIDRASQFYCPTWKRECLFYLDKNKV